MTWADRKSLGKTATIFSINYTGTLDMEGFEIKKKRYIY